MPYSILSVSPHDDFTIYRVSVGLNEDRLVEVTKYNDNRANDFRYCEIVSPPGPVSREDKISADSAVRKYIRDKRHEVFYANMNRPGMNPWDLLHKCKTENRRTHVPWVSDEKRINQVSRTFPKEKLSRSVIDDHEVKAVEMMRHALARQNAYCAERHTLEWSAWSGLVVLDLARAGKVINDGRDQYFHVTNRGRGYLAKLEEST